MDMTKTLISFLFALNLPFVSSAQHHE
ncbi:MAG: hypothetical protein RL751_687, partial [Bacteroidota bacterium]